MKKISVNKELSFNEYHGLNKKNYSKLQWNNVWETKGKCKKIRERQGERERERSRMNETCIQSQWIIT